jgi:hypothetical protein
MKGRKHQEFLIKAVLKGGKRYNSISDFSMQDTLTLSCLKAIVS